VNSISRGFRLARASWGVVRDDPALLWLPVLSFICSLVVIGVFALGMFGIGLPDQGESPSIGIYVLGFVMYVALSFVTLFFNAAVIGTAMKRLKGEEASLSDGFALARAHVGRIFVWSVITATVGMIIRSLQERAGLIGRILLGIVGIAWSVLTYFVLPVLLYEEVGVGQAIKRSGSIFRQRWGEQFIGNATIGLAMFVIGIGVALVGGLVAAVVPVVGVPLLVIAFGALLAVGAACSGVFNAALYRYATTGESSGAFSIEDMNASFRPRRGRSGISPFTPGGFSGQGFGGGPATTATGLPDRPAEGPTDASAPERPDR
jgi:hypothetical protein